MTHGQTDGQTDRWAEDHQVIAVTLCLCFTARVKKGACNVHTDIESTDPSCDYTCTYCKPLKSGQLDEVVM